MKFNTATAILGVLETKKATIKDGILPWPVAKKLGVHCIPITKLHEACVLCERGGANLQRWANGEYRTIVYRYRPMFFDVVTNSEKRKITLDAQQEVKEAGLELVRQFKSPTDYPFLQGGRYYSLSDDRVYSKIIQLIRDGKPGVGKNKKNAVKVPHHSKVKPPTKAPRRRASPLNREAFKAASNPAAAPRASTSSQCMRAAPTNTTAEDRIQDVEMVVVASVPGPTSADAAKSVLSRVTSQDERECWGFWHLLSHTERKAIAQRHGYATIGAYEEDMNTLMVMGEDCCFGAVNAALPATVVAGAAPVAPSPPPVAAPAAGNQQDEEDTSVTDVAGLDDIPLDNLSSSTFLEDLDDLFLLDAVFDPMLLVGEPMDFFPSEVNTSSPSSSASVEAGSAALQHLDVLEEDGGAEPRAFGQPFFPLQEV